MNRAERRDAADGPQSFGRYRIRGLLGEGGMGRLYVAEQTGIEGFAKIVALKRILPHLADSAQFRELFLNEARVAARLEHPNIVATYELGEVDGIYFTAMEYLPGEDLSAILSRCEPGKAMPIEVAAALAQQSANGLHYAHELRDGTGRPSGLVHRDVNPSNIFVTYYGTVKLLDFGVVKATMSKGKTSPGVFKGKYAYCAPEQIRGEPIDLRTDVFSLGIVLWECLTGQRLFEGATDASIIDAVRTHTIVAPSRIRREVPQELDDIAMRALMRDRKSRYQSANEMSEALDRFLTHQPHRPTGKGIGHWLEALFGPERSALKKAIAQGSEVEQALGKLQASDREREAEAEERTSPSGAPPMAAPAARPSQQSVVRPRQMWSSNMGVGGTMAGQPRPSSTVANLLSTMGGSAPQPTPPSRAEAATPPTRVPVTTIEAMKETSIIPRILTPPSPTTTAPVPVRRTTGGAPAMAVVQTPTPSRRTSGAHSVRNAIAPPPRRPLNTVLGVAGVVVVLGTPILLVRGGGGPAQPGSEPTTVPGGPGARSAAGLAGAAAGGLMINSEPTGAHIFVDGDPSGLVTPATLVGLRPGRSLEIRVSKPGYEPAVRRIEVAAGAPQAHDFKLLEGSGTIRLEGLPPGAIVYLDDARVDAKKPFTASVGKHRIRAEEGDDVVFSETITVKPGDQTLRIRGEKRRP